MSVMWVWSGAMTETTAVVTARCTGTSARLGYVVGTSWGSPMFTATVPVANGIARFNLSGLAPGTPYTYRIEEDGVLDASDNQFRTVVVGAPYSFRFAAASCSGLSPEHPGATSQVSNSPVYDHLVAADPLFFIQTGDLHYRDITTNDPALYRTALDDVLAEARPRAAWRAMPVVYMWDDHDYGPNNSSGSSAGKPAAQSTYRERVPHYPLASTTGAVWQTFVIGRVRFILTDLRSDSSGRSATDDASKVLLGAEQEAWFKATVAAAAEPLIVWVSTLSWAIESPLLYDTDHWQSFGAERERLFRWLASNGHAERILMVSGDNHANSYAEAELNPLGRFPVVHFGSLDATPLTKGGPFNWTEAARGQFGTVDITDDGSSISAEVQFRRLGAIRNTVSWTFPRQQPADTRPAKMNGLPVYLGVPLDGWA